MKAELQRLESVAQRCIHCGLCLEDCPTYLELGDENDSPRGRILLMRAAAEGRVAPGAAVRVHLDRCLDCRACESACPSGVRYGELIEHARAELAPPAGAPGDWQARLLRWSFLRVAPCAGRFRRLTRLARWAKRLGLLAVARCIAPRLAQAAELLPLDGPAPTPPRLPEHSEPILPAPPDPAHGEPLRPRPASAPADRPRATVTLFAGCATSALTPRTLENALLVLRHNGCVVDCPRRQGCCGAIHYHSGDHATARQMARANIDGLEGAAPLVNVAAGCGAMLRQYGDLLADDAAYAPRAAAFAARVCDISEFLVRLGPRTPQPNPERKEGADPAHQHPQRDTPAPAAQPRRIAYHDACHHLHAQGIAAAPRALLRLIPGVELVEPREAGLCCGAAGTYNLTQPELAERLARRKLANLAATGAAVAATGNVGCILHLRRFAAATGTPLEVAHVVDLLAEAYAAEQANSRGAADD